MTASGMVAAGSSGCPGEFEGYASLFNITDASGDIVMPGAFRASLVWRGTGGVRMLFQHDPAQPVGVWLTLREDTRGLYVRGRLSREVARARELAALLADGAIDGLSIGFRTRQAMPERGTGRRRLQRIDLWEISLVTFPMLAGARVTGLKSGTRPVTSSLVVPPCSKRPLHAASQPPAPDRLAGRLRRGASLLQH